MAGAIRHQIEQPDKYKTIRYRPSNPRFCQTRCANGHIAIKQTPCNNTGPVIEHNSVQGIDTIFRKELEENVNERIEKNSSEQVKHITALIPPRIYRHYCY